MAKGNPCVSVAIETTCRAGGLALGAGDDLVRTVPFDASARHATQLICRLDELLGSAGFGPADVDHLYVSAGPGSFTGTRIGITVARTLAQVHSRLRVVAVPTVLVVADNARDLPWEHLAVVLDAREHCIHATRLTRQRGRIVPVGDSVVCRPEEFLAAAPRPLLLIGEGLEHYELAGEGLRRADPSLYLPRPESVWRLGRRLAREGQFADPTHLLPVYARSPKVLREQQARDGDAGTIEFSGAGG